MDAQTTPTHNTLWHKGFAALSLANVLLTTAVYMMMAVAAGWLRSEPLSPFAKGCIMGAYGIGLFLLGPLCSFLVERYRRNHVCELAVASLAAFVWLFGLMHQNITSWNISPAMFALVRMAVGAMFGLAQMVLSSTLVIDVCESFQRTCANHATAWFGRIALCLGPLMALLMGSYLPTVCPYWPMALLCVAAVVLIQMVPIPFRAPSDSYPHFSLDRFLLPASWPLFLILAGFCTALGYSLTLPHPILFYLMMLVGVAGSMLERRMVSVDGHPRIAIAVGFIVMAGATLLATSAATLSQCLSGLMTGFALGVAGCHLLTTFLNLSNHCQRGTSQSSYFLSWETGVALGVFLSFGCPFAQTIILTILAVALLSYLLLVYPWYVRHKVR